MGFGWGVLVWATIMALGSFLCWLNDDKRDREQIEVRNLWKYIIVFGLLGNFITSLEKFF